MMVCLRDENRVGGRGGHFDIDVQYSARNRAEWFPGESLSSHLSARSVERVSTRHLIDAPTMASHALKQVCSRIYPSRR